MEERNMKNDKEDYDYYIPCSYNSCEKDVLAFENKEKGKKIYFATIRKKAMGKKKE